MDHSSFCSGHKISRGFRWWSLWGKYGWRRRCQDSRVAHNQPWAAWTVGKSEYTEDPPRSVCLGGSYEGMSLDNDQSKELSSLSAAISRGYYPPGITAWRTPGRHFAHQEVIPNDTYSLRHQALIHYRYPLPATSAPTRSRSLVGKLLWLEPGSSTLRVKAFSHTHLSTQLLFQTKNQKDTKGLVELFYILNVKKGKSVHV